MTTHIVIPDCQVRPGDNLNYLYWMGMYVAEVKPDKERKERKCNL